MKKILKSKKGLKNNKGITLVALIITVILMLILAGVAISVVIDGDGLFRKSREATKTYEDAAKKENNTLSSLMDKIDQILGKKEDFPLTEAGIYRMTINAGKTAMWLGVDLKNPNIPEGASINIRLSSSDDLQTWDEEKTDILAVRNSQYLKVIVELVANENGEAPSIESAKVRFKTDIETFEPTELQNMTQQENGWVALNDDVALGSTGSVTQTKELTAEDKENGVALTIGSSDSGTGITGGNGIVSSTGNGDGYSTMFYKSSDGQTWTAVNSLSASEIADANYVKAVTTVEKTNSEILVGPLVANKEGVSATVEKETEKEEVTEKWIDIKTENYDFDANSIGKWLEIITDETVPEGTRIKYYFAKSNDESTWTEFSEDITANGDSRYLKLKIVYQKEDSSITNVPVLNDFYIKYNVDDSEKTLRPGATLGSIVSVNQTYDGKLEGTYNNPIIPKGFAPINESDAEWGTAEGYKKGLVIQDDEENQYVWVPVDGTMVTIANSTSGTIPTNGVTITYSETLPNNIKNSIATNQGYYIARFEAGYETVDNVKTLVSKQNAPVWNNDTFSNMNAKAVAKYTIDDEEHGVVSTLIYGSQWDTALKFIGAYDVGEAGYATYATDSSGMGNYNGTSEGDSISDSTKPTTCGALPTFKQKNIYDMAGNAVEWTMEYYYRVEAGGIYRGGCANQSRLC